MTCLKHLIASLSLCSLAHNACAATLEFDGLKLEESAQVAGRSLKLNGAGVGARFLFKVYLIGLYLLEHKTTPEEVLATEGPLRVEILMLRDVSGGEFRDALADAMTAEGAEANSPLGAGGAMRIASSIAARPGGLRKGDLLTLDWVPGLGTVVEINRKVLVEPVADRALFAALLNVWIGPKPTDPALKKRLLGQLRSG